nr:chitin-binding lectin 1-like [Pseudochaenichthys georgianus]
MHYNPRGEILAGPSTVHELLQRLPLPVLCLWFVLTNQTLQGEKPSESHFHRAVLHEGYTIHRCGLNCRPQYHFHCCYCQSMLARKSDFVKHLALCKAKHSAITPIIPDPAMPIMPVIPDPAMPIMPVIPDPAIPIIPDPSTPVIPDPAIPIIPDPSTPVIPDPAIPIIPGRKMQRAHGKKALCQTKGHNRKFTTTE